MRRLNLHISALNNAEYSLYTASLDDLAESHATNDDDNRSHDDAYYDHLTVDLREARAWFRGRCSHVPISDIDSILKYFHPNLGQSDTLTGGQFFAAFRMVMHAKGGDGVDRELAFVQVPDAQKQMPESHSGSEERRKRRKILPEVAGVSESERVLTELYESIEKLTDNPVDYAEPSQAIPLPFPSKNEVPPRFDLSGDGLFSYIGREKFTIIWEAWLKIKADVRHRQAIYVYGTRGYGKSHILAALACLLVRKKEPVVYLPDCRAMLQQPLEYLRNALLLAFVGSSFSNYREWICECEDIEGLAKFCEQYKKGQLCFIIDQLNALDPEPKGEDDVSDDRQFWLRVFLQRLGKSQERQAYGNSYGRYTCGLARQGIVAFLRMHAEESIFLGDEWYLALMAFKNLSVIGFTVEQMIISRIASRGLHWGDNDSIPPTKMTPFHGKIIAFSKDRPSSYYVPLKFNFKAVDAIYVKVNEGQDTATVVAIKSPWRSGIETPQPIFLHNGNNGPTH